MRSPQHVNQINPGKGSDNRVTWEWLLSKGGSGQRRPQQQEGRQVRAGGRISQSKSPAMGRIQRRARRPGDRGGGSCAQTGEEGGDGPGQSRWPHRLGKESGSYSKCDRKPREGSE